VAANGGFSVSVHSIWEMTMGTVFQFTITAKTPLLMHKDDVEASDRLKEWRTDPKNQDSSVPGDDRSPAWTWMTHCYSNGKVLAMPADNLSAALLQAGMAMPLKGNKTFKELSQTGLFIVEDFFPLLIGGREIPNEEIEALTKLPFREQAEGVKKLGFTLLVKRAKVGQAKHVRVRACFAEYTCKGTVEVVAKELTDDRVNMMFDIAGDKKGWGDGRPGSPRRPWRFGRFNVVLKKV
jgi:hypothetical protein